MKIFTGKILKNVNNVNNLDIKEEMNIEQKEFIRNNEKKTIQKVLKESQTTITFVKFICLSCDPR